MSAASTSKGDDLTCRVVGVDSNRIFEVYTEDTAVKTYLLGYTAAGVTFFTNAVNKSLTVTGAYQDVDLSADSGAATALGVIFNVQNTAGTGYAYALRRKGSTDDFYNSLRADVSSVHLIGVDAGEVAQMQTANAAGAGVHRKPPRCEANFPAGDCAQETRSSSAPTCRYPP